jgi:hypothetical protein
VQAFKGSLSRRCVSQDRTITLNDTFCGGHYYPNIPGNTLPYLDINGNYSNTTAKGNICAKGFECVVCEKPNLRFKTLEGVELGILTLSLFLRFRISERTLRTPFLSTTFSPPWFQYMY